MIKSRIWKNCESGSVEVEDFSFGRVAAFSARNPFKPTTNEDVAFLCEVSPNRGVLAVIDGMGGGTVGDRAASEIASTFKKSLENASDNDSLRPLILDAIELANENILSWGIGSAATLAAAEFDHGRVRSYHVGDASILQVSNRGRIKFATVAHGPTALGVESGMLSETEAMFHDERNLVTNCVGCPEMRIEIGPSKPFAARDTLLVASDGISDNLFAEELVEIICRGDLQTQADQLTEALKQRMNQEIDDDSPSHPDDHTFFLFRR